MEFSAFFGHPLALNYQITVLSKIVLSADFLLLVKSQVWLSTEVQWDEVI